MARTKLAQNMQVLLPNCRMPATAFHLLWSLVLSFSVSLFTWYMSKYMC